MLGFTKNNSKMKFHKLKDSYSGDRFQYSSRVRPHKLLLFSFLNQATSSKVGGLNYY